MDRQIQNSATTRRTRTKTELSRRDGSTSSGGGTGTTPEARELDRMRREAAAQADSVVGWYIGGHVIGEGVAAGLYAAQNTRSGLTAFWKASEVVASWFRAKHNGLPVRKVTAA